MKLGIDLTNVKTMSSRVVVPTGNYPVRIIGADIHETKNKQGHYLQVDFEITAGDFKGTGLTDRLNINNQNQDATRIGLQKLKTIATVGGHSNPNFIGDTDELTGLRLNIYVEENETSWINSEGETIESTENNMKAFYEYSEESASSSPKKEVAKEEAPAPWTPSAAPAAPAAPAPTPQPEVAAPAAPSAPAAPEAPAAPAAGNFPWMK